MKESLYALLLVLLIGGHQSKHKDRPQPGFRGLSERNDREETQLRHTNGPCNVRSDETNRQCNLHPQNNNF